MLARALLSSFNGIEMQNSLLLRVAIYQTDIKEQKLI